MASLGRARLARTHTYAEVFWKHCADLELAASTVDVAHARHALEQRALAMPTAAGTHS